MKEFISIITPTYNEAKNIGKLAELIHKNLKHLRYELIVVDDNSPDGTGKIAKNLSPKLNTKVLNRPKKLGLASAVVDGLKLARGDFICVIDADLSHPPELILELYSTIKNKNADIVIASRLVKNGGSEGWPRRRKLTSYIANFLAKGVTEIKDPMSGFFIFKKDIIDGVDLKPIGYKILLEMVVRSGTKKYHEIPFIFKDRTAGSSKITIKTNIEYLIQLLSLYLFKIIKI